jgi:hypothetical protein
MTDDQSGDHLEHRIDGWLQDPNAIDLSNGWPDEDEDGEFTCCPLCGTVPYEEGLGPTMQPGVYVGYDLTMRLDGETNTMHTVRRRWQIVSEIGAMSTGHMEFIDGDEE